MGYLILAYRNLTRRRLRSLLTISAIAIIIIAFFTLAAVYTTIDVAGRSDVTMAVGKAVGYPYFADLVIVGQKGYRPTALDPRPPMLKPELADYEELLAQVEALPQVAAAAPHLGTFALKEWELLRQDGTVGHRQELLPVPMLQLQGIDPAREQGFRRLGSAVVHGSYLTGRDDPRILVGYRFAKFYNAQVGDKLRLIGKDFERDFEIGGIFMTMTPDDGARAFVSLSMAQDLLGTGGAITDISVVLAPGKLQEAAETITPLTDYSTMFPAKEAIPEVGNMVGIWNVQQQNLAHSDTLLVLGFLGWLFVFQAMSTAIYDRTREIGIMKAIGWGRSDVWWSVLGEAAIIGLVGGSLGYAAGVAGPLVLTWFGVGPLLLIEATLPEAVGSVVLAMTVCLLAAIIPADMAANVAPLEAIRRG